MIEVQIDGIPYTAFTSYNFERDMETICSTFSLELTTLDGGLFPIKRGAEVKAIIDGKTFCHGYVDKVRNGYSVSSHTIMIAGRDKTQDIVDSTLDNKLELNTPISLENVIKKVLSYLGLSLKVINKAGALQPFSASEIVSAEIGQGCFDLIENYARKREVMLTTDGDGNIILTRGEGEAINASLLHKIGGSTNNVKSAEVEFNDEKRFYSYVVRSQLNKNSKTVSLSFSGVTGASPAQITSSYGNAVDDGVRATRKLVIKAETSSTNSDAKKRAQWEREIRRARALNYVVTLDGFKYSSAKGAIWEPLQIVTVKDDFASIDDELLIKKVSYNLSLANGQQTTLELVPKIAYNLEPAKKKYPKKGKKGGVKLNFNLE
jgi:prophage tail gpP-like protein